MVQHKRIIESAILLIAGMIIFSIMMSVFQLPRAAQPLIVNALLGCHDLALSCCREIAKTSVMEYSL